MKQGVDQYWSRLFDGGRDFSLISSQEISRFLRQAETSAPKVALDVGCGTGQLTRELYHRGYDVVGVDASESAVRLARSLTTAELRHLSYLHFDIESDDLSVLPHRAYGLITCKLIFAFIRDRHRFVGRIAQLLVRGGTLVVITPLRAYVPTGRESIAVDLEETLCLLREHFAVEYYRNGEIGYFSCTGL